MRAWVLVLVVASGCGFAAGRFKHPGAGTPIQTVSGTIVSQTCQGGQCQTTGTTPFTVSDRVSVAIGTANGIGRLHVANDEGTAIDQTGVNLHVYLDFHYHVTPGLTLAIDGGIDLQNLDEANTMTLGQSGDSISYTAINLLPRLVRTVGPKTQVWFGGGYAFGNVGTLEANNWRLNLGAHRIIGTLWIPVMLRIEATMGLAGQHDFRQQTLTGGFVFWFEP